MSAARSGSPTLFVVAGEVSGDMHAAHLITELRRLLPGVSTTGVGGPRMAEAGTHLLQDSTGWGVIGYVDPVLRLPAYLRRLASLEAAIRAGCPDLLLLVDFAAFNLRLAERLRGLVPVAYYFPPMVSVRKGARARKIARLGVRVLATLRREAAAYEAAGADVVFVGHPVVDLASQAAPPGEARRRLGFDERAQVVGLLPGSRRQEIRAHLPVLLEAAARILGRVPDAAFVLPVPASDLREIVEPQVARSGVPVRITDAIYDAMRAATILIAATGTATLEAAVLGVPLVAVYRLPWLSWVIINRVVTVRHAALPNILAGREIIPELLQDRMTPAAIEEAVVSLLANPLRLAGMRRDLLQVTADLGPPGAAARAAAEVARLLMRVAPAHPQR